MRAALGREEDVNQTGGSENRTPLMHAAGQSSDNHISILRLLLERPSTDLNLADVNGSTALHLATFCGNIEAVRLLLDDPRVDVNLKDLQFQMTPLISAAGRDNIDILKLFLDVQSVDVNLTFPGSDNGEVTALMWAVMNSKIEAVKLLLDDPRVEVNWMNSRGMGALHMAGELCETWFLLQKRQLDRGELGSEVQILKLFLAHHRVDVNSNYEHGSIGTVLHRATAYKNVAAVKLILAEPRFTSANALTRLTMADAPVEQKGTAAFVAAVKCYWEVLKELVNHPSIDLDGKQTTYDGKQEVTFDQVLRY